MTREELLEESKKCVLKDRQNTYGPPEDSFKVIAAYWSVYLSQALQAEVKLESLDVAMMMGLLKTARIHNAPKHVDNFVDLIGYAACGGEIAMR